MARHWTVRTDHVPRSLQGDHRVHRKSSNRERRHGCLRYSAQRRLDDAVLRRAADYGWDRVTLEHHDVLGSPAVTMSGQSEPPSHSSIPMKFGAISSATAPTETARRTPAKVDTRRPLGFATESMRSIVPLPRWPCPPAFVLGSGTYGVQQASCTGPSQFSGWSSFAPPCAPAPGRTLPS